MISGERPAANLALLLPADDREQENSAQLFAAPGVRAIGVMTNNPARYADLTGFGLALVERAPIAIDGN
ncbi:hypothetical protein [Streptomyces sp. NPDC006355]|uniref:hypothetical protein n=1 Tax=Streptomyces sp. NPDC006355 TaxID=3156758 RepID=UPI0033A876C3